MYAYMKNFFHPLSYENQIKQTRSDPCERKPSYLIKLSDKPYLCQYLVVRKYFMLQIAAINQIFTGYKIYLLEIIGKLRNKTKHATYPYTTFNLRRPVGEIK
jgi:hypothetical protein